MIDKGFLILLRKRTWASLFSGIIILDIFRTAIKSRRNVKILNILKFRSKIMFFIKILEASLLLIFYFNIVKYIMGKLKQIEEKVFNKHTY